jgi:hypothetical protein
MANTKMPRALRGDDTSFGVFYPKNYVLAVFTDPAAADRAAAALEVAGFLDHDALVVGSDEVLGWHRTFHTDTGLVDRFKRFMAQHFGSTEAKLADVVDHAHAGHTFVLAYAPDAKTTERAANALRPAHPRLLRKFEAFTIADLT